MIRPPIVLPWKFLAQANHRLMPVLRGGRAMLITSPPYRQAKESAELSIKRQWGSHVKLSGPLSLTARCWFPDRRKRDAMNLAKMVGDALSGIVYDDDSQIEDERWIKAGTDKENPRVEIVVRPIEDSPEQTPQ